MADIDLTAAVLNIKFDQGSTVNLPFTWRDENRDIYALSSFTGRMQFRSSADSEDFVLELTTENGGIELGDEVNNVRIIIDAETSASLTPGAYKHDLEVVSIDGGVAKFIKGKVTIVAEVTK